MDKLIGFIGQGWIGKNYADDFEERGYKVVRYSRQEHGHNRESINACDIVFIAVPTPTTPDGFDDSALIEVMSLVGKAKIAVIKSTVLPHTTDKLQKLYPDIFILHSPEFLSSATAAHDARHPVRNVIGTTARSKHLAEVVLGVLPKAPYNLITDAATASLIKYGGNCSLYARVLFMNTLFDLCKKYEVDYEKIKEAVGADPRIGTAFLDVVHGGGRGAGNHCFIKDFAAYRAMVAGLADNQKAQEMLETMEDYNIQLLSDSKKSLDLLKNVYGEGYKHKNPPIEDY